LLSFLRSEILGFDFTSVPFISKVISTFKMNGTEVKAKPNISLLRNDNKIILVQEDKV
jgi:hypothetical protein